jgi:tetratricopeptide (TPR) repeat protein
VSLVDLEPTLGALFDLPRDGAPRDGRVLAWDRPESGDALLYAETFHPLVSYGWSELRALRRGAWKLIAGPENELYNLREDPLERVNLAPQDPHDELLRALEERTAPDDPEAAVARAGSGEGQPRELLESLGYFGSDAGARAAGAPGRPRPHPREELPRWLDRQNAKELFRRATALAAEDRLAESVAMLDSVSALDPEFADAHFVRGVFFGIRGEKEAARAAYEKAIAVSPDHARAHAALAELADSEGRREEAFAHWTRVNDADPEQPGALRFLALWWLEHDSPERAQPHLRRLVSQDSTDAVARFNLGYAAYRAGAVAESREHLLAFLRLAPEDPDGERARRWLAEMSDH